MAELKLEQLSKVFGDQTVVRDLNLTIPQGAFTALLGPSGCGKTTTLRILAGLEELSSGRLLLGDKLLADNMTHTPPELRDMGMVFQSYALWPHMTVAENVGYPLKLRKVKGAARQKQVMDALDIVELGAYADRSPRSLVAGSDSVLLWHAVWFLNQKWSCWTSLWLTSTDTCVPLWNKPSVIFIVVPARPLSM